MPLEVRPGITIRRPRREVAAMMFDEQTEGTWLATCHRAGSNGADARTIRFLFRRIPINARLTLHDPERFREYQADTPYPVTMRLDLESIPEGTLTRIRLRVQLRGLLSVFTPLVARRLRRSLIWDLETLKDLIEATSHHGIAAARPAPPPELATPAPIAAPPATPPPVTPPGVAMPKPKARAAPAEMRPIPRATIPPKPRPSPDNPPGAPPPRTKGSTPDW